MKFGEISIKEDIYLTFIRKTCNTRKSVSVGKLKTKFMEKFEVDIPTTEKKINEFIAKKSINISNNVVSLNLLANSTRRQIFNAIKQYPGIYISLMKKKLQLGSHQLLWHLSLLEEFNQIQSFEIGNVKLYGNKACSVQQMLIGFLICRNNVRLIFKELLSTTNGYTISEISKLTKLSITTLTHWVKKLNNMNLFQMNSKRPKKIKLNIAYISEITNLLTIFNKIFHD